MNPNRDREEEIFEAACQIRSASERAAFLARMCAPDTGMQRRLEAMLEAEAAAREFFDTRPAPTSAGGPAGDRPPASLEKEGDRIGRYRLLQQIGEGGMGVVYMAEQSEPVRRTVALKIIKLGMDTREVVARFEAERQALALMDHPHIAKVLDAGATESGRPFFVMELVRGVPITEYCDKNCLATDQRLGLFVRVCQAVQHAHQKGIIHRDLKPSNILVTHNDGNAWPMIIDFGIAKATHQRLTEKTLFTRYAQLIGTPAYMSPEQAEMSKLDVDTRTDIYALGVLLYELLTGTTPFPTRELLSLGYREMQRTISEKEPPRPSTRLSTMAREEKLTVARQRKLEPSSLEKLFRGDLDWIAMKCLEKDRARRYETANGLAMDIQRHLQNEPVIARPPSQWYRFQKTFQRHRLAFVTSALVFSLLMLATLGVWGAARREARARLQETAQRRAAEEALQRAEASERAARESEVRAEELRKRAELGERVARQRTYASDINLAQQALSGGDLGGAMRLLDEAAPDLRGWEWRYLWQQTRSEARAKLNLAPGWLYCIRSSPDGRWLATMDAPTARVHVWDMDRQSTAARLPGVDSGSAWPVFSPVSAILAYHGPLPSQTNRNGLVLWDPRTARPIAELPTTALIGFGFSTDGKTVFTCDADLAVLGWELNPNRLVSSNSFEGVISAHQFLVSGDGSAAVLGDYSGNRCAVDLRTGQAIWHHRGVAGENGSLALSRDGRILAVGPGMRGGPILLYATADGKELGRLEGHRSLVRSMVFWPDGRRLASASLDQTIRVWDIQQPAMAPPPRVLRGHRQEVWGLDLLPDGQTLVSASKDGEVCVWGVDSGVPQSQSGHTSMAQLDSWSFSRDSRSLLAIDLGTQELVEWPWAGTNQTRTRMAFSEGAHTVCWAEDGSQVAVGHTNGSVQIWALPGRTLQAGLRTGTNAAVLIQFNRDGNQLALFVPAGEEGARLEIRETATGGTLISRPVPRDLNPTLIVDGRTSGLQLSPDLQQLFARTGLEGNLETQRALLWSIADDRRLDLGVFGELGVVAVAFSPEGSLVAASGYSGETKVWDAKTGKLVAKLEGMMNAAAGVTFSPDGKRLVVGSGGGGICKIWDVETWRELMTLRAEGQWLHQLKFSPDGSMLGARSDRHLVQYWRAPSVEEVAGNP